jgi:hypothetical protein
VRFFPRKKGGDIVFLKKKDADFFSVFQRKKQFMLKQCDEDHFFVKMLTAVVMLYRNE